MLPKSTSYFCGSQLKFPKNIFKIIFLTICWQNSLTFYLFVLSLFFYHMIIFVPSIFLKPILSVCILYNINKAH